jgi:methyl-accepting chemotaxis protein
MQYLSSISLKWKVPGVVVSLCLLVAFAIGLTSYFQFRKTLLNQNSVRFEEYIAVESEMIRQWFETTINDVGGMGLNPTVAEATVAFQSGWDGLGADAETQLQSLYISQNLFPIGEKHRLDAASDGSFYSSLHKKFHPYFRSVLELNAYYDVFLFDVDGNLIYSVYKESDFATNFLNGAYAQTGLGRAFRDARGAAKGEVKFIDYSPYAPSADAPAGFLSTPVYDAQSNLVGVYAIQFPIDVIQTFINVARDKSAVDQLYLVGTDGLLRSQVEFDTGAIDVFETYPTDFVNSAVATPNGLVALDAQDAKGTPVVAAAASINFLDTTWFAVAEPPAAKFWPLLWKCGI